MEKLTLDYYQKERFELIGEINEDYIEGYFVWNETIKRKRKMIDELIDDEDEYWFLDKDGYRLEDHDLFERSPWSLVIDNRIEKIVERFFDYRTGEARFAIRPWLRIGDELNSRRG